jgi:hypothetical protein
MSPTSSPWCGLGDQPRDVLDGGPLLALLGELRQVLADVGERAQDSASTGAASGRDQSSLPMVWEELPIDVTSGEEGGRYLHAIVVAPFAAVRPNAAIDSMLQSTTPRLASADRRPTQAFGVRPDARTDSGSLEGAGDQPFETFSRLKLIFRSSRNWLTMVDGCEQTRGIGGVSIDYGRDYSGICRRGRGCVRTSKNSTDLVSCSIVYGLARKRNGSIKSAFIPAFTAAPVV